MFLPDPVLQPSGRFQNLFCISDVYGQQYALQNVSSSYREKKELHQLRN